MIDVVDGTVDSEQVIVTISRVRRVWRQSREWQHVGAGKGENGRDYDYIDAILPQKDETTVFRQVLDGTADVNALVRAVVDVTTKAAQ